MVVIFLLDFTASVLITFNCISHIFKLICFSLNNRPFPSCCEPHYESEATCKCKAFHVKISFVCIRMKTNFHNKNFALSLVFTMKFKATRKIAYEV